MLDRVQAALAVLTGKQTPATTPTTPVVDVTATPVSTGAAAAAPAPATPATPQLITISVNGIEQAKQYAVWLTKGKDRTQPTTAVLLKDCTSDHLKNIVANKPNLSADYRAIIESILEDRGDSLPSAIVGFSDDPSTDDPQDDTNLLGPADYNN